MTSKEQRHVEVAEKMVELLRTLTFNYYRSDDIAIADLWDDNNPARGIHVSIFPPVRTSGTNQLTDIKYRTVITRVITTNTTRGQPLLDRSDFLTKVRLMFDEKRMGLPDTREMINRVRDYTWRNAKLWQKKGLDVCAVEVRTLIREDRG